MKYRRHCVLVRLTDSAIERQTCRHTPEGLLNLIFTLTLDCKHNEELYFQSPLSVFLSCTILFTPLKKKKILDHKAWFHSHTANN